MATDGPRLIPAAPLTLATSVHLTEQERKMMKSEREKALRAELAETERERAEKNLRICRGET